ncbi:MULTISPECIES: MBL fold metallo-hydrolase [Prauserella salsuginis group]|uniref:Glyoxylase-like metal-dependent hydrolase (Beta-lactamase superfamily II) n=2 Tax=Prauserella salsuginis group TaxID=2893672 RepID=A0A839XPG6_9PSEU|nr:MULTISPECIES: MBL fold metallo-hydrolase [Prauserella salsuginis group]MBB3665732.1 glyoxylase-like metal-dependent hydrolase (beta-lactamase superfamily II) [Prauserella sediminis]MCR3723110.1 Glyoxylase, beta-lactamase superfamily II [Prauserella flava]MCR3732515.1 Glyoxylase, beta-lactamase superfamily II [Prauserella salsuginis]
MLVAGFPAGTFQANCYLLAPGPGGPCVVVDPGEGASAPLDRAVAEYGLTPAAILATHGHPDHVHTAAEAARTYDVPVWIRPEDRPLLRRPWLALNDELAAGLGDRPWSEPDTVRELGASACGTETVLDVAGLRIEALHTPGHTEGSVVFRLVTEEGGQVALTGDTLLPGSAGRTDLPGGDPAALRRSLAMLAEVLDDAAVLLPGHGRSTTMGQEKASNPWLAASDGGPVGVGGAAGGADALGRTGAAPAAPRGTAPARETGERRS